MNSLAHPVDYEAWNRGYMPPSEHVLIDKLAYRGAKVHLSTALSIKHQMWVVLEGPPLTNKQRKFMRELVGMWFDDVPDERINAPDPEEMALRNAPFPPNSTALI